MAEEYFISTRYARYALSILFAINLFNYIDRQVIFGVFPLIQKELLLSDSHLGLLASAFMFIYLLASVPLGILGDRWRRNIILSTGVALWSLSTIFSGIAKSFGQLFLTRALVGIGEASYGPTATAMVSDYYPKEKRGFANSLFNSAIPLGGALGITLGGVVGQYFGWRSAFLVVALPGLILSAIVWHLKEPPRGASDKIYLLQNKRKKLMNPDYERPDGSLVEDIVGLFKIPTFVIVCIIGMMVTFAVGALAAWIPTYMYRVRGYSLAQATMILGGIQSIAGFSGVIAGGLIGDYLMKKTKSGHLITIGAGFVLSAPCALIFLLTRNPTLSCISIFLAVFFLVLYTGIVNAVIHNVVVPNLRATAIAIFVFLIHLGGDAFSPAVIGIASDRRGLHNALIILPYIIFFAGLIAFAATRVVSDDMKKMEEKLSVENNRD